MFCSIASFLAILGAVHIIGSIRIDIGTAVTTINDCKASILPSPILIRMIDIAPIMNTQKTRITFGGSPSPVTAMEMEKDMESAVETTNTSVRTSKINTNNDLQGSLYEVVITAADDISSINGVLPQPLLINS